MATKQEMKHCYKCKKMTLHLADRPSHLLHLALSVLTFGIWLVVWFLLCLFPNPMRCSNCGDARIFT